MKKLLLFLLITLIGNSACGFSKEQAPKEESQLNKKLKTSHKPQPAITGDEHCYELYKAYRLILDQMEDYSVCDTQLSMNPLQNGLCVSRFITGGYQSMQSPWGTVFNTKQIKPLQGIMVEKIPDGIQKDAVISVNGMVLPSPVQMTKSSGSLPLKELQRRKHIEWEHATKYTNDKVSDAVEEFIHTKALCNLIAAYSVEIKETKIELGNSYHFCDVGDIA